MPPDLHKAHQLNVLYREKMTDDKLQLNQYTQKVNLLLPMRTDSYSFWEPSTRLRKVY